MKERFKQMKGIRKKDNQYGITLIALVITIIVLLILTGVSIAMLTGQNGILTQAQKAKTETENATKNEVAILNDYEDKINDALGIEEQAEPGKYYETNTEVELGGKELTIPGEASLSKIEGEYEDIDKGVVIYITNKQITDEEWQDTEKMQTTYDQFVWIPVNDINDMTTKVEGIDKNGKQNYTGKLYDFTSIGKELTRFSSYEPKTEEQENYDIMVESVSKNKGFWLGRYDISKSENKIEIKKGKEVMIENWSELTTYSQSYDDNVDFYKSTIIWGSQYDAMLSWMQNNKINVTEVLNAESRNKSNITGNVETDKINNIYDLSANFDWSTARITMESLNNNQVYRIVRSSRDDKSISERWISYNDEIGSTISYMGYFTRITLYMV